jgi:hypothetical protein
MENDQFDAMTSLHGTGSGRRGLPGAFVGGAVAILLGGALARPRRLLWPRAAPQGALGSESSVAGGVPDPPSPSRSSSLASLAGKRVKSGPV